MALLRGADALERARSLFQDPKAIVGVEADRDSRGAPPRVIALGTANDSLAIDVAGTPGMTALLGAHDRPFGAVHAKALHRVLLRLGEGPLPSRWADAVIAEQLLLGGREGSIDPDAVAMRHLREPLPSAETGLESLKARASAIARLVAAQIPRLREDELVLTSRLEAAAVAPIAEMEAKGMPFDAQRWKGIDAEVRAEQKDLRAKIMPHFAKVTGNDLFGGATLNLDNDNELKKALAAIGHRVENAKRETLQRLPEPLGPLLARYREVMKLVSAYGEAFLEYVGADGRLHPTFTQIGANTGRMACHSPNLQSMVKDSPHRTCFRVAEDRALVTADYGACELRIIAELSGDPVFAEAFARGEDLHARVATAIFGKPVSKNENPELRQRAKAVNFGLAYGMGAQGLARAIDTDVNQARQLLERYFKSFPRIRAFLERSAEEGLSRGFARTMTGRRLYLEGERSQLERIAKNMPIQGTNADITKIALARLRGRLGTDRLVNVVHDEIVCECAKVEAEDVATAMREEMVAAGAQVLKTIPLTVDVSVGEIWGK
ncbi:MAG: DNA polymerase [Myxococcota bacterium]|nr:DNA polymerase [Myxococcota bacterium]